MEVEKILAITIDEKYAGFVVYYNNQPIIRNRFVYKTRDIKSIVVKFKKFLQTNKVDVSEISGIVSEAVLPPSYGGGVYIIDQKLADYSLNSGIVKGMGAVLAYEIGIKAGVLAYTVDPCNTDELMLEARFTGIPRVVRHGTGELLFAKGVARMFCEESEIEYKSASLIVIDIDKAVTVSVHKNGKVIELFDDIAFGLTNAGHIAFDTLAKLAFKTKTSKEKFLSRLKNSCGLKAHMGTSDIRKIIQNLNSGDEKAKSVFESFIYNISKAAFCGMAALRSKPDAFVITGKFMEKIFKFYMEEALSFIAKVYFVKKLDASFYLARGVLAILQGKEKISEFGVI